MSATSTGHQSHTTIPAPTKFKGDVNWVEIAIDEAAKDIDHVISPEERLRVAMALQ